MDDTGQGKAKRSIWVCDVCKEFKHKDFDTVERHEEQCQGPATKSKRERRPKRKNAEAETSGDNDNSLDTSKSRERRRDKDEIATEKQEKEKAKPRPDVVLNEPMTATTSSSSSVGSSSSNSIDRTTRASQKGKNRKRDRHDNTAVSRDDSSDEDAQEQPKKEEDDNQEDPQKKKQKKPTKLASIFNNNNNINQKATSKGKKDTSSKKILKENNGKDQKRPNRNAKKANAVQNLSQSSSENSSQSAPILQLKPPPAATKRKQKTSKSTSNDTSKEIPTKRNAGENKASNTTNLTNKKRRTNCGNTNTNKKNNVPLAAIFQTQRTKTGNPIDNKALMAEQRAVENQARRRKERELERERQRKREENFHKKKSSTSTFATTSATSTTNSNATKHNIIHPCPRFPVPSFVLPPKEPIEHDGASNKTPNATTLSSEQLHQAKLMLQRELPFVGRPCLDLNLASSTEGDDSTPSWQWTHPAKPAACHLDGFDAKLSNILASAVSPPSFNASSCASSLWVDTHSLVHLDDICGAQNQQVAKELVAFVKEWMVHRQEAHERMAERQKALQKKRRITIKKKRSTKDSDETDLWCDTDDEDDGLARICLIEGPVGSCKSSLVHAVARHCECQVVELNTSDKRGSADLRKVLEEATRSHSSLDMLKKRQANIFAKQQLVDSDDEDEDSADGDEADKKGTSLTMILVDEADNTFETCGDSAFWSALNDLARKAQCPIFLTANIVPKELCSVFYKHVSTLRPSADECARVLNRVLVNEGILSKDAKDERLGELASLAETCDCDLRRILHRLQLFCCVPSRDKTTTKTTDSIHPAQSVEAATPTKESTAEHSINITKVSPKMILSETHTTITIKGKNFGLLKTHTNALQHKVKVIVGEQLCPAAKIVDDTTIVAVCPACPRSKNVDKHGMRNVSKFVRLQSLDSCFAPVSLQSLHPRGSLLVTSSSIFSHTLVDDTRVSSVAPSNIEWRFPEEEDESDVEFDDSSHQHFALPSCLSKRKAIASIDTEEANRLLKTALEELEPVDSSKTAAEAMEVVDCRRSLGASQAELDALARDLERASDATLLNDYLGLPFLSGASPGFGYQFTPEGESSSNTKSLKLHGNSTHCSEDRLFALGWKETAAFYGDSNAWVSLPMSARDRNLIKDAAGMRLADMSMTSVQLDQEEELDDLTLWSPPCPATVEEDGFLPRHIPASLLSLPASLIDSLSARIAATCSSWDTSEAVLRQRRNASSTTQLSTIGLVCEQALERMCFTGFERIRFTLDYLPMLRNMAIYERAAQSVEDAGFSDAPRRRTRTTAKKGRSHYFEELNKILTWGEGGIPSVNEAGDRIARTLLQYNKGV